MMVCNMSNAPKMENFRLQKGTVSEEGYHLPVAIGTRLTWQAYDIYSIFWVVNGSIKGVQFILVVSIFT